VNWIDQALYGDADLERIRAFVASHGGSDEELRFAFAKLPVGEQIRIKRILQRNAA
jgi:hypothetical protein